MNIPTITIEEAQETVENSSQRLQNMSRRAMRAYMGLLGLAYDEAKTRWQQGQQFLERAENRGQKLDEQAMSEAQKYYEEAGSRISTLQKRVRRNTAQIEEQVGDELETRIEAALNRLNIPSREQIMRLNAKIETLSRKIEEVSILEAEIADPKPMPQYEQMTTKKVVSQLAGLNLEELDTVKTYEMAHENRVTVLRAIEAELKRRPEA